MNGLSHLRIFASSHLIMTVLLTSLASRSDASCVCHGAPKDHLLLPANPICIPYAAATVVRKTDPKEQTTALVQAGQKALGWVEEDNLKEVVFEFRAEDLDLDVCEPGDGDVYAYLRANGTNPPVVKISRTFEGTETDLGTEAFKDKTDKWVATWKFTGDPGVYSFEFAGEIEDRYDDHPDSDDPKDLNIQWFRSQLAVSVPVEVDIVSDQTDYAMPWNCTDPAKYAKIVTTLSPEGAVGAFTLKIMDGTTVVRTLVAGETRAGGTWTDTWNGLKDDGTPAEAKAYTVRADWVVPETAPAGDEEYPVTVCYLAITWDGAFGNAVVSDLTNRVSAGHCISLSARFVPDDIAICDQNWAVPPIVMADYYHQKEWPDLSTPTEGHREELSAIHASDVRFYWVDGNSAIDAGPIRSVTYSCTIGGKVFSSSAHFDVKRPGAQLTINTGQTGIYHGTDSPPGWIRLGFGLYTHEDPSVGPGISITNINVQAPWGFGAADRCFWTQILSSYRIRIVTSNATNVYDCNGLDGNFHTGGYDGFFFEDSPYVMLHSNDLVAVNEGIYAATWLMFEPFPIAEGLDSRPIPLKNVLWTWQAAATNLNPGATDWWSTNNWRIIFSTNTVQQAVETFIHPEWTNNVIMYPSP